MLRLHYADGSVLVSNDVGEAVLRYAQALASTHGSDIVDIPIVTATDSVEQAHFLLGPASQLLAVPETDGVEHAADQDVVDDLDRRTRLLRPTATFTERSSTADFDLM